MITYSSQPKDTIALFQFLGWQGGTIHQVAEVSGCSVHDLIYGKVTFPEFGAVQEYDDYMTIVWENISKERILEDRYFYGNTYFWLGVRDWFDL